MRYINNRHLGFAFRLALPVMLLASSARAGNWPTWRHDAGRSAATDEELPARLVLQWRRQLAKPAPAWPKNQIRLQFDASYEPVVMGKHIFVPSMVRDNVTAYDTETGLERWRFYADGPVRFAPAAADGKVFFVSDDGYLYCLQADTGKLLWKFRGGSLNNRIIGNDRLISIYPARGAPVVCDGKVYFAAGIWPFMGTFIHALNGKTGKVLWSNSGSGSVYILQPHSSPAFGGVAPQGYLAATKDRLLVPGGRSVPACYDRNTGKFLYFHTNNKLGIYKVWATGQCFFNFGRIYNLADGGLLGKTPASILTKNAIYGIDAKGNLTAHLPDLVAKQVARTDRRGKKYKEKVFEQKTLWKMDVSTAFDRIFILAGRRIYGSKGATIAAIDLPERQDGSDSAPLAANVSWQTTIETEPWTMLAADGKLFVVTGEGMLYCFGSKAGKAKPLTATVCASDKRKASDRQRNILAKVLAGKTAREGYCVVLGIGDGKLTEKLVAQSKPQVIVIDPDARKVADFRRRLDDLGLYGTRVTVHAGNPLNYPLPPYLADLIVSDDIEHLGFGPKAPPAAGLLNALRPYGGTACFAVPENLAADVAGWAAGAKFVRAGEKRKGLLTFTRVGPLPGSADWAHQYCDVANTVCSADKLVKAPLGLLWFGGPTNLDVLPRHGHGPTPQVVAGRLVIEGIGLLSARDVYTGRLLWRRRLDKDLNTFDMYYDKTYKPDPWDLSYNQVHLPGANALASNYVTTSDRIYLISGPTCFVLDARTGLTVNRFTLPPGKQGRRPNWGYIGVKDNLLIAAVEPHKVPLYDKTNMPALFGKNDKWRYLAGKHPHQDWTQPGFKPHKWNAGPAGFGFGNKDAKTQLKEMRRRYSVLYALKEFTLKNAGSVSELALMIRYDDAFIAYLNGREIARAGIKRGSGKTASGITTHSARRFTFFPIKNPGRFLREGRNVLAVEGHNVKIDDKDFLLQPYLLFMRRRRADRMTDVEGVEVNFRYASASGVLVVMDRHKGNVLWSRPAKQSFRHNAIVAGAGKVFCIDGMSQSKIAYLKRRGYVPTGKSILYALDIRNGNMLWQADENVFGTWLSYSARHDVLLQAGSHSRDRAKDEANRGMVAYRAADGKVLWKSDRTYLGPPILHKGRIITQVGYGTQSSSPATAFNLLTGEQVMRTHPMTGKSIPWTWIRFYGCNTAVASENLLTFRSASAAFVDLVTGGGTASIGGFKSGCTSNLIVANGVLNAPDYTRTCTCSYQNQSSLALVHMPEVAYWTVNYFRPPDKPTPVKRVGLNLGAPGNRVSDNGTLWLEFPSIAGPSPDLPVRGRYERPRWFRLHHTLVKGNYNWVAASGVEGLREIRIRMFLQPGKDTGRAKAFEKNMQKIPNWPEGQIQGRFDRPKGYTVRLHFAEPESIPVGERIFNVAIQGKDVLKGFDIVALAGGANRSIVREFRDVMVSDDLKISLTPVKGEPLLCGIEVRARTPQKRPEGAQSEPNSSGCRDNR